MSGFLAGGLFLSGCNDNVEILRDPDIHIKKGMTWAWRPLNAPEVAGTGDNRVISRDTITPGAARNSLNSGWKATGTGTRKRTATR